MRVTKLTVKNIGPIADAVVELNKPLILFYGEVRQGKSTLLNAIKWCFGGSFPSDIIRHGAEEAQVKLEFENGFIERSWYVAKDQTTKARDVKLIIDGKPVARPTEAVRRFLNPFLLNQNHLVDMTELERKRFFLDLFGVNTLDLDNEISKLGQQAHELRIRVKTYGDIDTTPVLAVDSAALKARLAFVRADNEHIVAASDVAFRAVREHNQNVRDAKEAHASWSAEVASLRTKLVAAEKQQLEVYTFICENQEKPFPGPVAVAPTSELEAQIEQAAAQNVRHEEYVKRLALQAKKETEEQSIVATEGRQREYRLAKINRLGEATIKCGVPSLVFTDDGGFTFQGTQAGMLSTSQLMELSSALSALYPDGLSLELIDRAESLGKSIFSFIDRAKAEEKTILATIVGERPSQTPAEVGVFVVLNGEVKA